MMSIALDLILVAIVAFCGWRGYQKGIINGVCGLLAIVIALYGAGLVASVYYDEFIDVLDPFASGIVDSAMSKAKKQLYDPGSVDEALDETSSLELSDKDNGDVQQLSYNVFRKIGFVRAVSRDLSDDVSENIEKVDYSLSEEIASQLCDRIVYAAVFIIVFLIIMIIFSVIGSIVDLSFGLPGYEKLNNIAGAVLGVIKGFLIIMIICCFCRYMCLIVPEKVLTDTLLLEALTESNFLAPILGL